MKRYCLWSIGSCLALVLFATPSLSAQSLDPAGLFPELAGWKKKGAAETFSPENLYEYIDGAAENFISYGFKQLAVRNYANDKDQALSAEIYFHGAPENAFGIYSSEKPLAGNYFGIGTNLGPVSDKWTEGEGYEEEGVLNFIYGSYYIKLNGFNLGPAGAGILKTLAEKIALVIPGENSWPTLLNAFPASGKVAHSERYILSNFLGHEFLHSAYTADYRINGQAFQLFIIAAASEADARTMLEKYVALDKGTPAPAVNSPRGTDAAVQPVALTVNDPYNGTIRLVWRGKFICGSSGQTPAAAEGITALAQNLPQQ